MMGFFFTKDLILLFQQTIIFLVCNFLPRRFFSCTTNFPKNIFLVFVRFFHKTTMLKEKKLQLPPQNAKNCIWKRTINSLRKKNLDKMKKQIGSNTLELAPPKDGYFFIPKTYMSYILFFLGGGGSSSHSSNFLTAYTTGVNR